MPDMVIQLQSLRSAFLLKLTLIRLGFFEESFFWEVRAQSFINITLYNC